MQRSTVRQKDACETKREGIQNSDQASSYMGQKRWPQQSDKKNGGERDEDVTMDVRSDTQRQDHKQTYPRNTETQSSKKIMERRLVRVCDEQR